MIKLEYFVVCEDLIIDSETNAVTLVRVLEDVLSESSSHFLPQLVAVASWTVEAGDTIEDHEAVLKVTPPGCETVDFKTVISKGRSRYRTISTITLIPLHKPGELKIELLFDQEHNATHTITVHPREAAGISVDKPNKFEHVQK